MEAVAKGGRGLERPQLTFLVPSPDSSLFVAEFRLRLDDNYVPTGIEESNYRCVNLKEPSIVEREGRRWCRYYGVLLDEASFATSIREILANRFPREVAARLVTERGVVAEWDLEYDPYAGHARGGSAAKK